MEKGTVLYIGQKSTVSQRFSDILANTHNVINWSMNQKGLFREIPTDVDCIVMYVDGLSDSEYRLLKDFLTIFPSNYEPVLAIGSKASTKSFRRFIGYPLESEIDSTKEEVNLLGPVNSVIGSIRAKDRKKEYEANFVDATLGIYGKDKEVNQHFENMFRHLCNTHIYDNPGSLLDHVYNDPPKVLLLSYIEATQDENLLISQIRQGNGQNVTLILFGPSMSQAQFQEIIEYKPNGYIMEGTNDADAVDLIMNKMKK